MQKFSRFIQKIRSGVVIHTSKNFLGQRYKFLLQPGGKWKFLPISCEKIFADISKYLSGFYLATQQKLPISHTRNYMLAGPRYKKIFILLFFVMAFLSPADSHAITIGNLIDYLRDNPELAQNPKGADVFVENCSKYPGFMNRIVQCINHITTRTAAFGTLHRMHQQFAMVTNVALVLYIMFFGMKLSLNVIQNIKGEIMVVLITCFFITYVNNAIRMENFVRFFINLQDEFVNVATISIFSAQKSDPKFSQFICYKDGDIAYTNIWSRIDCMIVYIMGAHPVVEKMGQMYNEKGTDITTVSPDLANLFNGLGIKLDQKYDEPMEVKPDPNDPNDLTNPSPFIETNDAYKFYGKAYMENISKTITSPTASDIASIATNVDPSDASSVMKANRPVNNNLVRVGMSYSLIVIMIGMLLNSPTVGVIVFLSGFFIILLIIVAFGQAVLIYITSLFAILVLGLFAPLILPTILFPQTKKIFETWVQLLFAYSIQPGIVLCYLSFMVYVLQYVISYKGSIDSDCKTTPAKCYNLAQFHFGDIYTKADKSNREAVKVISKTSSRKDNYGNYQMQASYTEKQGSELIEQLYSGIGKSQDFADVADQIATEDNELVRKGFKFNDEGTESKFLSLPGFNFFGGSILGKPDIGGAISKLFFNYNTFNSNVSVNAQNAQDRIKGISSVSLTDACIDPLLFDPMIVVVCLIQKQQQQDFALKIAYMQTLLIILITLCITFVFMNNVMDFTGKLVGAGVSPIGKAMSIYDLTTNKLGKMLRGPVR